MAGPSYFDVAVDGGALRVARWGEGPEVVLGIHGITGSSMGLAALAAKLDTRFSLIAPDLRGRGASSGLPGPFGVRAHAADCAAVLDHLASSPVVVVGHSMGANVAVVLAASRPDLVARLILVDGGLPLRPPPGVDPDAMLAALLGPALERLRQTFRSRDAYQEFWQAHPALVGEWNEALEAYVDYDLVGTPPELHSRVSEAAIRSEIAASLATADVLDASLRALTCPVVLFRAPRGLLNQPAPLLPSPLVQQWQTELPHLRDEVIDDTNHYTVMFGDRGVRTIARYVEATAASSSG